MIQFSLPNNVLNNSPSIDPNAFVASGAQVMGNVIIKKDASIWYNAVLRGDINQIIIGERSNIQDGCILHMENDTPCIVENDVTVGHHVNLHACHIEESCLIGIGAIVLSGARIGRGSIIGAGAVILENSNIPPFSLVVGCPGKSSKKHRKIPSKIKKNGHKNTSNYPRFIRLNFRHLNRNPTTISRCGVWQNISTLFKKSN